MTQVAYNMLQKQGTKILSASNGALAQQVNLILKPLSIPEKLEKLKNDFGDSVAVLSQHTFLKDGGENASTSFSNISSFQGPINFDTRFKITNLFTNLSKTIGEDGAHVILALSNSLSTTNIIEDALKIASAKINQESFLDNASFDNATAMQDSARQFIEKYTRRDYNSSSQLAESTKDLFKDLLFANTELSEVKAVHSIIQAVGLREFRFGHDPISSNFRNKLTLAFGGAPVADEIVKEIFSKVRNYVIHDKIEVLNDLKTDDSISPSEFDEIKDEFQAFKGSVAEGFLKLVDRKVVQRLDRNLGLGLLSNYENILQATAQLSSERYNPDSKRLPTLVSSVLENYLVISNKFNDITNQHEYSEKLDRDLYGAVNQIKEDKITNLIPIQINPAYLDQSVKSKFQELQDKALKTEKQSLLQQIRNLGSNDSRTTNPIIKSEIELWLELNPGQATYNLDAFTVTQDELRKLIDPNSQSTQKIKVNRLSDKAEVLMDQDVLKNFIKTKIQEGLLSRVQEIDTRKPASDKPFILMVSEGNLGDIDAVRATIQKSSKENEKTLADIELFKKAVPDSIQSAVADYIPNLPYSILEAMKLVSINDTKDVSTVIFDYMKPVLNEQIEKLLASNCDQIDALRDATQAQLRSLSSPDNFSNPPYRDQSSWEAFLDHVETLKSSDCKLQIESVNARLQDYKDSQANLSEANVDTASLQMFDQSYKKLIYKVFLDAVKNIPEGGFDFLRAYQRDIKSLPSPDQLHKNNDDSNRILKNLASRDDGLILLQALKDGSRSNLSDILLKDLREDEDEGLETVYEKIHDNYTYNENIYVHEDKGEDICKDVKKQIGGTIDSFIELLFSGLKELSDLELVNRDEETPRVKAIKDEIRLAILKQVTA